MAADDGIKMPAWAIGLIATNLIAGAGTIITASTWKGAIETELRETRKQFADQINSISRKLDQQEDTRERLRVLEVKVDGSQQEYRSRGESMDTRLTNLEATVRNRSVR
jgi:hypothetical protein